MNKSDSINYFLNLNPGVGTDSLYAYFGFDPSPDSSTILLSSGFKYQSGVKSGEYLISGEILPLLNNFWQESGRAHINNNYIKIPNVTGINSYGEKLSHFDFQNFSFVCVFKNYKPGGSTILSTVQTGIEEVYNSNGDIVNQIYLQGFEFGVTSNNKLYFEYFDKDGPKAYTSDFFLPNKAAAFLNIYYGNVYFGYYNYFDSTIYNQSVGIKSEYIFSPDYIYIGYNPMSSGLYNLNRQFSGYFEQILFFNNKIYDYEIQSLCSGFTTVYTPPSSYVNTTYETGVITGYELGIIGYETGITGYDFLVTGTYDDGFGNTGELGVDVELYEITTLSGYVPLTGTLITLETGYNDEYVTVDYGYINQFGKNNINILNKIDSDDLIEVIIPTGAINYSQKTVFNPTFDRVKEKFIFNEIRGDFSVYVNGQLVTPGSGIITGSVYNKGLLIINDYYKLAAKEIEFADKTFKNTDGIFADTLPLSGKIFNYDDFSAVTSGTINLENPKEYSIFINGQKLTNNLHYQINGNDIIFIPSSDLYTGITGQLTFVSENFNYNFTGSNANYFNFDPYFYQGFSKIYKNGIRQYLDSDYLELSDVDSNSGKAIFEIKSNLIYNNQVIF
jgi:hypothetical protein